MSDKKQILFDEIKEVIIEWSDNRTKFIRDGKMWCVFKHAFVSNCDEQHQVLRSLSDSDLSDASTHGFERIVFK